MKCRTLLALVLAYVVSLAWPQSSSAPVTGSAANQRITLDVVVTDKSHPDEYHDLQVKIEESGVVIRALTGHYAQP